MIPDYMLPFANHLWQSTLFALTVWLIVLTLRKNRAAVRHRLWLAASVKFLVPFSLLAGIGSHFQWETASVMTPADLSTIVETISQPFSASRPSPVPPGTTPAPQASLFPAVLTGVWICGVAASLFWWFIRWRQVHRAVRLASPLNLHGPLRVMYGSARVEPGVFGIFRPVLLLPEGITHRLSPAQLEAVLAHELCHVRRRDNLCMAIHMIVEALCWFHPFVWLIKVRLIEEQERACDEEVLRLGNEPTVYAESLLKVCEFYLESPLTCVTGVTGSDLKERVVRIMRRQIGETLNRWRKLILVAVGIAVFATPVLVGMVNTVQPFQDLPHSVPREGAKQLIDNARVTVWEITMEKGKPSPMHRHRFDMVGVELSDATLRVVMPDNRTQRRTVKAGQSSWASKGYAHSEETTSDTARYTILVDLKDVQVPAIENKTKYPLAFPRDGARKLFENARVTVWDYTWTLNKPTPMHFHDKDVVVVFMADGQLNSTTPEGKTDPNPISFGLTRFNARDRVHSEELVRGAGRAVIFELK